MFFQKILDSFLKKEDFFILFELSKFQSTRNLILKIIKKDQKIMDKLEELVQKRSNKTLIKKMNFAIKKLKKTN